MGCSPIFSGLGSVDAILAGVEPARITTRRLRLERLGPGDAEEMARVLSDPALYRYTGGAPPAPSALRDLYRRWERGPSRAGDAWHNWVVRVADGAAVGHAQATVTVNGRSADMAWVIGTPWQGRGFATEAAKAVFDWLVRQNVTTVTAHVHPDNVPSGRVAEKIGLVRTSRLEDGEAVWQWRA